MIEELKPCPEMIDPRLRILRAFKPEWERLGVPAKRLGRWTGLALVRDARGLKELGLIESRMGNDCFRWRLTEKGRARAERIDE